MFMVLPSESQPILYVPPITERPIVFAYRDFSKRNRGRSSPSVAVGVAIDVGDIAIASRSSISTRGDRSIIVDATLVFSLPHSSWRLPRVAGTGAVRRRRR